MYTYLMINGEKQMKTVKIAICDDETALREMLRRKIEKHCQNAGMHCQIFDFDSGESLLALPAENVPDVLFLDIQMPGKTGCRLQKNYASKIRI